MIRLRYGNTNTFFIPAPGGGLLIDTDYAGTLPGLRRALRYNSLSLRDIRYVLATHYHPDHSGLTGLLTEQGVKLLLPDIQKGYVHFSDSIFSKDGLDFIPVNEEKAAVITCAESRAFLGRLGIYGEIISTPSHSPDSISVILDDGDCFVGDLEPMEHIEGYDHNEALENDWKHIMSFGPKRIFYSHYKEKTI
jgi:glyoxylase-like metal-dependent hydrolase (beta-lactamase superfamily II)